VAFDERLSQYDLGEDHPFRGDRFQNAMQYFKDQGLFQSGKVGIRRPQPASTEDLLRVHTREYVDLIFRLASENRPYDIETPVSERILEAALLIAGGGIECGQAVFDGKVKYGVSLGGGHHHAGKNYGGGFCLFNDVAVLVEHLRTKYRVKRFLILDYDVHFGNGTSDIYYQDPTVLYISLHQDPRTIYPGTGFIDGIGAGEGEGFNVNVPLPVRTGDATYLHVLNEIFVPLAEEYKPEVIIANGGSDSHFADSLGSLGLTAEGFFEIATLVRETADKVCHGRLVLIPGSGYNPKVLPLCWFALVAGVAGTERNKIEDPYGSPIEPSSVRPAVERTLDDLKRLLRKRWTCFGGFAINNIP
jgi:acetoin utilization deacetylase AcuC-like enzyme